MYCKLSFIYDRFISLIFRYNWHGLKKLNFVWFKSQNSGALNQLSH